MWSSGPMAQMWSTAPVQDGGQKPATKGIFDESDEAMKEVCAEDGANWFGLLLHVKDNTRYPKLNRMEGRFGPPWRTSLERWQWMEKNACQGDHHPTGDGWGSRLRSVVIKLPAQATRAEKNACKKLLDGFRRVALHWWRQVYPPAKLVGHRGVKQSMVARLEAGTSSNNDEVRGAALRVAAAGDLAWCQPPDGGQGVHMLQFRGTAQDYGAFTEDMEVLMDALTAKMSSITHEDDPINIAKDGMVVDDDESAPATTQKLPACKVGGALPPKEDLGILKASGWVPGDRGAGGLLDHPGLPRLVSKDIVVWLAEVLKGGGPGCGKMPGGRWGALHEREVGLLCWESILRIRNFLWGQEEEYWIEWDQNTRLCDGTEDMMGLRLSIPRAKERPHAVMLKLLPPLKNLPTQKCTSMDTVAGVKAKALDGWLDSIALNWLLGAVGKQLGVQMTRGLGEVLGGDHRILLVDDDFWRSFTEGQYRPGPGHEEADKNDPLSWWGTDKFQRLYQFDNKRIGRGFLKYHDISNLRVILVPINSGVHWFLAVVDFENESILVMDSCGTAHPLVVAVLAKWVVDISREHAHLAGDLERFKRGAGTKGTVDKAIHVW